MDNRRTPLAGRPSCTHSSSHSSHSSAGGYPHPLTLPCEFLNQPTNPSLDAIPYTILTLVALVSLGPGWGRLVGGSWNFQRKSYVPHLWWVPTASGTISAISNAHDRRPFPVATVADYPQIGGLKQKFTPSQLWRPGVRKQLHEDGPRPGFLPRLFQLLGAPGVPRLMAPSLLSLPAWSHHLLTFGIEAPSASPLRGHLWRHLRAHPDNPGSPPHPKLQIGSHPQSPLHRSKQTWRGTCGRKFRH